ncbi:MAG: T9SS type A sorting domain-containing protein [Bacteroidota bacterium]
MQRSLLLALGLLLLATPASAQVTVGQSDDFQDGTTQDWRNGRNTPDVSNVATGGPDGAGDSYLQVVADGSFIAGRLAVFNDEQWSGDFTAAGVTSVTVDLNNTGANDLVIRLWIENNFAGPGDGDVVSTDGVSLPAGSGWQSFTFSVLPEDLTPLGATSAGDVLTNVRRFRFYHGPTATAPGPNIVAELGLDNITADGAAGPNFDLTATNTSPLSTAPGGSVSFDYTVTNNTSNAATGDVWFTASPGGQRGIIRSGTLPAGQTVSASFTQPVPGNAPPGIYTYTINLGQFPNAVVDSESFALIVAAARSAPGAPLAWAVTDAAPWSVVEVPAAQSAATPERFALHAAYPNPFETATSLGFDVPEATSLNVTVYDVLGREVAVLLDRTVEAGRHTVRLDGAGLSRGVYLVRLQAGAVSQVRRVTLVR